MAAKRSYSRWGLAAIAGGVILTGIEVVGAVGYLVSQSQPSYLVAGGAVVTVLAAILLPLAERCWRRGQYLKATFAVVFLVPALSLIVCAAVERTGGAKDEADRDRQVLALKARLAERTEKEAKVKADAAEAKADAECSRSHNPKADPRGPLCLAAEERAETRRKRLETARGELAKVGVVPKDPMVSRIAAVLPVSEEAIALYQPLILPITISGLGLLLIAIGAHAPKPRKVVETRQSKQKRGSKPKTRASPQLSSARVIPLRRRSN